MYAYELDSFLENNRKLLNKKQEQTNSIKYMANGNKQDQICELIQINKDLIQINRELISSNKQTLDEIKLLEVWVRRILLDINTKI